MTNRIKWPKEVPIPKAVGKDHYYHDDGAPCCALGHAQGLLGDGPRPIWLEYLQETDWGLAYQQVARFAGQRRQYSIAETNDSLPPRKRLLLYLAAWAYCGYVVGMPKEAVELAEKAKASKKGGRK